jgi:quercetin dioxygenase-like cupin family protein
MHQTAILRGRRTLAVIAALVTGAVIGMGADHLAFAQQPGIKRTILLRTDSPENPAYEVVMAVAEIAPGASAGKHRHNGIEVGYVLQGSAQLEHEGRATLSLKAGEAFKNEAGVHDAKSTGKVPLKILAVYLVEKGKPLAEPVP